jgi:hypothetical protein
MIRLILFLLIFFLPTVLFAKKIEVNYAGFSYLGNNESQFSGMPLTTLLTKEKKGNQNTVDFAITDKLKKTNPKNFNINFSLADLEKGNNIMMSIGISKEIFSEEYNSYTKAYNNSIGLFLQIYFYDFKEKKLIAAVPIYGEVNFISQVKADNNIKLKNLRDFYDDQLIGENGEKIGITAKIKEVLENFELKEKYRNRIGVTKVDIEDRAKAEIPNNLNQNELKNEIAQSLSSKLSLHQGVSIVPFIEGVAIGGTMKARIVQSSEIYNISLPKPDFFIELGISNFRKGIAETSDVSDIWQYGSAITVKIYEPDLNKIYLNDRLVRVANIKRAKGTDINHWGKFYFNNQILLEEFAINISKQNRDWVSSTSEKREFSDQLNEVNKLLEKVR